MTTVVLHGGEISCDSQVSAGKRKYTEEKFLRGEDSLYLWAGEVAEAKRVARARIAGEDEFPKDDDTVVFEIIQGKCWVLRDDGASLAEGLEAWGTGADAAVAAVLCGKDSRGACEIATQVDLYSGGRVRTFSVDTGEEL